MYIIPAKDGFKLQTLSDCGHTKSKDVNCIVSLTTYTDNSCGSETKKLLTNKLISGYRSSCISDIPKFTPPMYEESN